MYSSYVELSCFSCFTLSCREKKKSAKFRENGASATSSSPYATSPKTHLSSSRRHKNTHTLSRTCVRSTTRTMMSSDLPRMGIGPDWAWSRDKNSLCAHQYTFRVHEQRSSNKNSLCVQQHASCTHKQRSRNKNSLCAHLRTQKSGNENSLCAHQHASHNWLYAHKPRSVCHNKY